jgi:hypothetical protein
VSFSVAVEVQAGQGSLVQLQSVDKYNFRNSTRCSRSHTHTVSLSLSLTHFSPCSILVRPLGAISMDIQFIDVGKSLQLLHHCLLIVPPAVKCSATSTTFK